MELFTSGVAETDPYVANSIVMFCGGNDSTPYFLHAGFGKYIFQLGHKFCTKYMSSNCINFPIETLTKIVYLMFLQHFVVHDSVWGCLHVILWNTSISFHDSNGVVKYLVADFEPECFGVFQSCKMFSKSELSPMFLFSSR